MFDCVCLIYCYGCVAVVVCCVVMFVFAMLVGARFLVGVVGACGFGCFAGLMVRIVVIFVFNSVD